MGRAWQQMREPLRGILDGTPAAPAPSISGHSPTLGPALAEITVSGSNLPTSGWGTTYALVIDDGFESNEVECHGGISANTASTIVFNVPDIGFGQARANLRIREVGGSSLAESPVSSPAWGQNA